MSDSVKWKWRLRKNRSNKLWELECGAWGTGAGTINFHSSFESAVKDLAAKLVNPFYGEAIKRFG